MVRRVKQIKEYKSSVYECVAYIRVSTKGQAESGVSLDNQEKKILEYVSDSRNRCHLDENRIYVDEGRSAFKRQDQRGGYKEAKKDIEKGRVNTLIVYSLSRAFRSVPEAVDTMNLLEKQECNIISVTEPMINTTTKTGRFIYYLFGLLSQFESEQISERVRDCMITAFEERGFIGGNRPIGYEFVREWKKEKVNGKVQHRNRVVKPYYKKHTNGEREIVQKVFELYKRRIGQGKIARLVGINGSRVGRILSNPTYASILMWNANNGKPILMRGQHEPYITIEDFNANVGRRVEQAKNHYQKKNPPYYIRINEKEELYLEFVKFE